MAEGFWYEDCNGIHKITLKRAAPEWCNADCPRIIDRSTGFAINNGVIMEYPSEELAKKFTRFFIASAEAFYKKYPRPEGTPNGFIVNFFRENKRFSPRFYKWLTIMEAEWLSKK